MKPIKAIHWADFHLGVDTIGPIDPSTRLNGRVLDYLDSFDAMIDYAEDNKIDIALFAGDAFNIHNPSPTYIREFGTRINRLSLICPVVMIPGNHDIPATLDRAGALELFDTFKQPGVIVSSECAVIEVETASGLIQVATVPYPMKQRLLTGAELSLHPDEVNDLLRDRVRDNIMDLVNGIDIQIPAILMGHFSISGAEYGSERFMVTGKAAEVQLEDVLYECFSYIALGHLHKFQDVSGSNDLPVVYSGSMERVDFGEEKDRKGFVACEVMLDRTDYEFVEVDARPYKTIEVDVTDRRRGQTEIVLNAVASEDIKGTVVRIIIHANDSAIIRTEEVSKAVLSDAYCIHSINIKRGHTITARLDRPIASLNEMELLAEYFKGVGKNKSDTKELVAIATGLMEAEYE